MPEPGKRVFVIGSGVAASAVEVGQGGLLWPAPPFHFAGITNTGYFSMNAAAKGFAMVGRVMWSDHASHSLQHIHLPIGTNVQVGSSVVRVSVQDVSSSAGPPAVGDGTDDVYRDITLGALTDYTYTDTGIVSNDGTNGGTLKTVAHGALVMVALKFQSYVGSDSLQIAYTGLDRPVFGSHCMQSSDTGSTWALSGTAAGMAIFQSNDGVYGAFRSTMGYNQNFGVASTDTPDEYVQKFRVPVKVGVDGFWWHGTIGGATGSVTAKLLTGAAGAPSTVGSSTVTLDGHQETDTAGRMQFVSFGSVLTLDANTDYWLSLAPNTTTAYIGYQKMPSNTALWSAFNQDSNCPAGSRTDAGAISDMGDYRLLCGLSVVKIWA